MPPEKFVEKLTVPDVLQPVRRAWGTACYEVAVQGDGNGVRVGPTLEVQRGMPIQVLWRGEGSGHVHVHGGRGRLSEQRQEQRKGQEQRQEQEQEQGQEQEQEQEQAQQDAASLYHYRNRQRASLLWYHCGHTAGLYIVRDRIESRMNLPKGRYEVPLLWQEQEGQDLVNGRVSPYLEVEPRRYRLRFVNGSRTRFYRFRLSSGQSFTQIGTDGGFLEEPVQASDLWLAPGERVDTVVDFRDAAGQGVFLVNEQPSEPLLQFRVVLPLKGRDVSEVPHHFRSLTRLDASHAERVREVILDEIEKEQGLISENKSLPGTELLTLINPTNTPKSVYLPNTKFQILDRPVCGWKDTVQVDPGETVWIIARVRQASRAGWWQRMYRNFKR